MKKNITGLERIVRLLLAAILIILFMTNIVKGVLGIVLLIIGVLLAITALMGYCPIYKIISKEDNKK